MEKKAIMATTIVVLLIITALAYWFYSQLNAPAEVGYESADCGTASSQGATTNTLLAVNCFYAAYTNSTNATMTYTLLAAGTEIENNLSLISYYYQNTGARDWRIWDTITNSSGAGPPQKSVINCFTMLRNSTYLTIEACSNNSKILIPIG